MTFQAIKSTRKPYTCYYCASTIPLGSAAYREKFTDNYVWRSVIVCCLCKEKQAPIKTEEQLQ